MEGVQVSSMELMVEGPMMEGARTHQDMLKEDDMVERLTVVDVLPMVGSMELMVETPTVEGARTHQDDVNVEVGNKLTMVDALPMEVVPGSSMELMVEDEVPRRDEGRRAGGSNPVEPGRRKYRKATRKANPNTSTSTQGTIWKYVIKHVNTQGMTDGTMGGGSKRLRDVVEDGMSVDDDACGSRGASSKKLKIQKIEPKG